MQATNCSNKLFLFFYDIGDISASTILKGEPESFLKQLKQWFSFNKLSCCWRASLDGWDSKVFHKRCDLRGKTITLIRVGNYIFGGYSTYYWGGKPVFKSIYFAYFEPDLRFISLGEPTSA